MEPKRMMKCLILLAQTLLSLEAQKKVDYRDVGSFWKLVSGSSGIEHVSKTVTASSKVIVSYEMCNDVK